MRLPIIATIAVLSLVCGCATKEELVARSADVPAGVDLSGQWRLRVDSQDTVRRISEAEMEAAGGIEGIVLGPERKPKRSRQRSSNGTLVHVFLETGKALKVTQTEYGLFISFDRAIVEEYRFGEKRQINVGPVMADRVSGWEGDSYIIETLDKDGAKLIETYRLQQEGGSLIRTISIVRKDVNEMEVVQVFDRV
ncbi:MAG: hypothetical protein OEU90_09525 [Gammaproteobacteria bacterium]|nr:hypothetical protein [Gammaproteobacteria bacterium]MDH3752083.1 hypothetical protein [Gammaproteobacteria bacterium]MDH3805696.1 hypothetical protein [Gammaproteobacteria bacterium]